jgi:phosphoglycolate phosphatase
MTEISRVVLFDIDGTLIHSARAGMRGMNAAFERLYGMPGALDRVPLAGRTDRAIVTGVIEGLGHEPTPEAVGALRDAYLEHLAAEMSRPVPGAAVLPGVVSLLDALAAQDDVLVGLLTGNFERGAAIKLGYFRLWSRFGFGAFGDEHVDRRDLVPVARAQAERAGGGPAAPPGGGSGAPPRGGRAGRAGGRHRRHAAGCRLRQGSRCEQRRRGYRTVLARRPGRRPGGSRPRHARRSRRLVQMARAALMA